jgi:hypothetical protein
MKPHHTFGNIASEYQKLVQVILLPERHGIKKVREARRGEERRGEARRGEERRGEERRGEERRGEERRGEERKTYR